MERPFHPRAWLIWGGAALTVTLLTRNPFYLVLVLLAIRWVAAASGLPSRGPGLARMALPVLGLTTFWNLVTVHVGETVLIELPAWIPIIGGPLTAEAALWGMVSGEVLVVLLALFVTLNAAVSPHELSRLAPSFLREAGLVASVALTFVPQSVRALEEIREAQAVRGHRFRGVRDLLPLLLPLLISGLERAVQLAEAMEARGYTSGPPPSRTERALIGVGLLGILAGWLAATLLRGGSWAGYLGALLGGSLLAGVLWRIGRRDHRTRYRSLSWTAVDTVVAMGAAVPALLALALTIGRPDALAYVPYPRVTLPRFDPLLGGSLALLALPAWVPGSVPRNRPRRGRPDRRQVSLPPMGSHGVGLPVSFEAVCFSYPASSDPVLQNVSFRIPPGAFVLVTGPSGVGKSTLLRCINGLIPHTSGGRFGGRVRVGGIDTRTTGPGGLARWVGFVFQDPEAQFVTDRVEEELAFALENAGVPARQMRQRVEEVLRRLELGPLRDRPLHTLSGGEMQRVAIASVLVLRPAVLVLDEPTSQLDPASADEVLQLVSRLRDELGITVVLAEHRLERVLPYADLMVYVPRMGAPPLVGPPRQVLRQAELVPPVVVLGRRLGWEPLPITVEEARPFAEEAVSGLDLAARPASSSEAAPSPALLEVEGLWFSYGPTEVLRGVDLRVGRGELVVLMGANGSGKTTLLRAIVGLLRPQRGVVRLEGKPITGEDPAEICRRIGYLPQNPDALLFAESVRQELELTLANHGLLAEPPMLPEELLERLGLGHVAEAYPRDLSVGQRARVGLGAISVTKPALLLLDEPTRGLDYVAKRRMVELLRRWREDGTGILLVTHDVEMAAQAADRVAVLEGGRIVAEGPPHQVLAGDGRARVPQVARLFPGTGWVTVEEVLGRGLGGEFAHGSWRSAGGRGRPRS